MQLELNLKAAVFAFPFSRRRDLVMEVARFILHNEDAKAIPYWRGVVRDLANPLLAAGVPRAHVNAEIERFHDAVEHAMVVIDNAEQMGEAK